VSQDQNKGIPLTHNRVTVSLLNEMKKRRETFAALSIYSAPNARIFDKAGGEVIIVGDSASMTMVGRPNTLPMTMEEMLFIAAAVCRGAKRPFVVGDMPLGSYEVSDEEAVRNALRFMKEVGDRPCNAVKMEINMPYIRRVRAVAQACLVVAHIGLNPNKAEMLGGYKMVGKTKKGAEELCEVALAAEEAGACMILIETVPEEVSQKIREIVGVPVFGIAAGRELDGQLVISDDLLGLYEWPGSVRPKHFRAYQAPKAGMTGGDFTLEAFKSYVDEVKRGEFPGPDNVHFLPEKEREDVIAYLATLKKK